MATESMNTAQPGHRRVRSEPFDFDEPDQGDILGELSVPDSWHKSAEAAFHDIQHSTQDSELAELQAYANPSRGIGSGSPDLSGRLNSVSLTEFPTASPRSVEAVWGELDSWMTSARPGESSPRSGESSPAPAPAAMGVMHSWHDGTMQGEEHLDIIDDSDWDTTCIPDASSDCDLSERSTSPPGQKRPRVPGGTPRKAKRAGSASTASLAASESSTPPLPTMGEPAMAGEPPALMEQPLPSEIAYRMLTDDGYQPGARPLSFDGLDGRWVFKEDSSDRGPTARNRVDKKADRWHNSGGVRGARDMPVERPVVRRRYGSVSRAGTIMWRFHEYSLVTRVSDPTEEHGYRFDEDRSTTVFHVMPKRAGRGRPSKAEADLPAQLWKQFGFAN